MKIEVFTKPNCPNCVTAKQLLKAKGMEYREINLDSDALRAEFMSAYPDARQMPQIFFDGQRVGGLAGLQVALNQLDLL
jgi:glutaredoxin 3